MVPQVDDDAEYLDLAWSPYDGPQAEAFDNDTQDARILVKGGFGSGKSAWLIAKCLKLSSINYNVPGGFVIPTFDHWDESIVPVIKSEDKNGRRWFLEDTQFHVKKLRSSMVFEWEGGGDWSIRSAMTRIVGANWGWCGADEPGLNAHKAWKDMVARVRNPASNLRQIVLGGTPEGLNWLADVFNQEMQEDSSVPYFVYELDTRHNIELISNQPAYVQDILRNSTPQEAAAYISGKFSNLEGVIVYVTFDSAAQYRDDIEPDPNLPLRITFDFNVDPMSCIIGQEKKGRYGREAHVVDAVIENHSWTPQVCDTIISRYGRAASTKQFGFLGSRGWPGGAIIYGDATGDNRTPNSNKTNYQWIAEKLGPEFPSFRIHDSVKRKVNPSEKARISAVNVLCRNALDQVRLYIRKRKPLQTDPCWRLVQSLQKTIKAPGTDHIHKPAGETHTHPSDALGYWIAAEWPVEMPLIVGTGSFSNVEV